MARECAGQRSELAQVYVFDDLNVEQAAGQACVVGICRRSFVSVDGEPVPASVVVGVSKATGLEVRACRAGCAQLVGWVPRSDWSHPRR